MNESLIMSALGLLLAAFFGNRLFRGLRDNAMIFTLPPRLQEPVIRKELDPKAFWAATGWNLALMSGALVYPVSRMLQS